MASGGNQEIIEEKMDVHTEEDTTQCIASENKENPGIYQDKEDEAVSGIVQTTIDLGKDGIGGMKYSETGPTCEHSENLSTGQTKNILQSNQDSEIAPDNDNKVIITQESCESEKQLSSTIAPDQGTIESNDTSENVSSTEGVEAVNDLQSSDQNVAEETTEPPAKRIKETEGDLDPNVKTTSKDSDSICNQVQHTQTTLKEVQTVSADMYENDFSKSPKLVTGAFREFDVKPENFLKGCKWAPDGTCLLTNSDDNTLRVFNLPQPLYNCQLNDVPEMGAILKMSEGELIYDYMWYPKMNSTDPSSCRLLSSCRDSPVHMWDAYTGELVCSYRAYDQADELTSAHSLAVSMDGTKLYTGFNKMIRVFNINRPGREFKARPTFGKSKSMKTGQAGIISCIACNPDFHQMYAAGSYSRAVALYVEPQGQMVCMFEGQAGGVTHLQFSPDGTKLYTGGRKDPEILCWDIRNPGQILFTMQRKVHTNQRVYFELDSTGQYLLSGNHDGSVSVWDTLQPPQPQSANTEPVLQPMLSYKAHEDAVNGVSLHPTLPIIATASGQRHFTLPSKLDESDSETEEVSHDNSVRLWWCGK